MARAFVPVLEANGGGGIVNVLTLVALASMPGLSTYNASKAAAWSLTQSLRASVADKGIAVYGVFPGAVDTDMLAGVEMPKTSPADIATAVLRGIEMKQEDIFPDPMSTQLYEAWKQDHKAVADRPANNSFNHDNSLLAFREVKVSDFRSHSLNSEFLLNGLS